jgi:hypothetical protein
VDLPRYDRRVRGAFVLFASTWLIACGDDHATCARNGHTYAVGDIYPAGDGCNNCTCSATGEACTKRACSDAGADAPLACGNSGGCPGPVCGALCCGVGEKCLDGACHCGSAAPCTGGNTCQAAGPIGTDECGGICCGADRACPQ